MPVLHNDPKEVIDTLGRARDIIIEKGWCRGNYSDAQGRHCTLGAVMAATNDGSIYMYDDVINALQESLDNAGSYSIVSWNDRPTRRKRDVVRLFDRAIRTLSDSKNVFQI